MCNKNKLIHNPSKWVSHSPYVKRTTFVIFTDGPNPLNQDVAVKVRLNKPVKLTN